MTSNRAVQQPGEKTVTLYTSNKRCGIIGEWTNICGC